MVKISISIDVPNLPDAIRFYTGAFGFEKLSEPVPGVVVMRAGELGICLLEKHRRLFIRKCDASKRRENTAQESHPQITQIKCVREESV